MKYNEGATKRDKQLAIVIASILILIIFSVLYVQGWHGTGGLQPIPDRIINTTVNETINISFPKPMTLANDADPDDTPPYEPTLVMVESEGFIYNGSTGDNEYIQYWTFQAYLSGTIDLYFVNGEYTNLSEGSFTYDYWIRVIVEE